MDLFEVFIAFILHSAFALALITLALSALALAFTENNALFNLTFYLRC